MSSEELIQKGLDKHGIRIDEYEYYEIGSTTLNQLKISKIVPNRDYGEYSQRKPDMLLVDRRNKSNIRVIVTGEYKLPAEFDTIEKRTVATEQCNDLAQELDSEIGVITDKNEYIWVNPKSTDMENTYEDRTTGKKRSYSLILDENKKPIVEAFTLSNEENKKDETENTLYYLDRIISTVNPTNSVLKPTPEVDPLPLAKSVWQDIYVNTSKTPIKCLYNVVELFIFKFLSDLKVLESPNNFDFLTSLYKDHTDEQVLDYYARNPRKRIRDLFPAGKDNTTIINGTIFVTPAGDPVPSQASLFKHSLKKYQEFGSLKHIKKEFKTKLFETFLKQSRDKSKLGQFLTPRKVVRAIVDMSDVGNLPDGSRFCDPFCGVGGFICEALHKPNRKQDFVPKHGAIIPKISYFGFDKGTDEDEERTIILAKANMLIYLSEIVERNPTLAEKGFAKAFNEIFYLYTDSNLGTLRYKRDTEDEKYDLILTNPPYITSGIASMKKEISKNNLKGFYSHNGKGVDSLALEWMIKNLKRNNGRAFVIVRDGLLMAEQNRELLTFLSNECEINCIISLPIKTFFNTPQKTYILGFTKKPIVSTTQSSKVFTYLVSSIGETLDVNRFETSGKSDLEAAKDLFNLYKGSPDNFPIDKMNDPRCKLISVDRLLNESWIVDNYWSVEEKIALGIEEKETVVDVEGFKKLLDELTKSISGYKQEIEEIE
jgi:type I restriction-modification system DNA methylase subunit